MSLTADIAAARLELGRGLLIRTCTRWDATTDWTTGQQFACHYEEASPQTTGLVNFEGSAAGYGVNVYVDAAATLNPSDRIAVDGLTLEVQRVAVLGSADGSKRAFCVKR